ncbi:hypothetical protein PILCRDRAFT_9611 [Piloderma croceum F 1598]|uniref:Protein kinase domain-containing protein n=1 Tax=Piloderma croceum (strain F 1598) TaxID=765440 RepID=A0A0C3FLN1_PILCF|nr:hypothetical protein PILCRDRAFT_9611 [Piloderma croceum F 1598]
MTFGIFPYMAARFTHPWYYIVEEVFDAVLQAPLQGFEFLHRHLVAHRDVGADNILINFSEGWLRPLVEHGERPNPFRGQPTSFPTRVTSLPILRNGFDHPDDYGRDIAPEMLLDKPHRPFKSDIFQLGKLFFDYFHNPTRLDHPQRWRASSPFMNIFTRAQLKGPVSMHDLNPMTTSQMVKRTNEVNARQVVKEKKRLDAELAKASVSS